MTDVLIKKTKHFKVVSADMPQLVECDICGRMTRTEWSGNRNVWACSYHREKEILGKLKTKDKIRKVASRIRKEAKEFYK